MISSTSEEIKGLRISLNEVVKLKIPIISFMNSFVVIHIDKNGKYEMVNGQNGIADKPIYISFAAETPRFWNEAATDYNTTPTCVVFDILKIMATPIDQLVPEEEWKFTFKKNSQNPLLLEFDSFDGTKKAASPAFLLAMILKEISTIIKTEDGKRPKKMAFSLSDDFDKLDTENKNRVEKGIQEACELFKIQGLFFDSNTSTTFKTTKSPTEDSEVSPKISCEEKTSDASPEKQRIFHTTTMSFSKLEKNENVKVSESKKTDSVPSKAETNIYHRKKKEDEFFDSLFRDD